VLEKSLTGKQTFYWFKAVHTEQRDSIQMTAGGTGLSDG